MKLIIAEKPSLGKAIQAWLRNAAKTKPQYNNYKVTWLFGHMLEMVDPEIYDPKWKSWDISLLPITPTAFKLQITNNSGIKAQVTKVKTLLNECSEIINAGDPDREGQLLVDELLEFFNNKKPVSRLWLAAIDDKSIEKAFNSIKPNSEYLGYKLAAETRSRADWLVGMNYSRAFSHVFKNKGYSNAVSIGRVQTPTLKLITDRDNEIKNFISKDFYELLATFSAANCSLQAKLVLPEEFKNRCDANGRLLDKQILESIILKIKNKSGIVSECSKELKTIKQPLLFSLSELQAVANDKFGYSAQEVLDIAQILYENKLTSYPRSDCRYLPESQFIDAPGILKAILNISQYSNHTPNSSIKSQVWNDKKITAHHAIVPTGANLSYLSSLKEAERNVFNLIAVQYLMQFYPEQSYEEINIVIDIEGYQFETIDKSPPDLEVENYKNYTYNNDLSNMINQGQKINCNKLELATKKTTRPDPYTEGTLIKVMENIHTKIDDLVKQQNLDFATTSKLIKDYKTSLKETSGLGTEATRANIIETLKKRSFITSNRKAITATEFGHLLINTMTNNKTVRDELGFLTSALTTAEYEQYFDEIQNGNAKPDNFFNKLYIQLDKLRNFSTLPFNVATNSASICPSCNKGNLIVRSGKFGKFKACSNYPECKFINKTTF